MLFGQANSNFNDSDAGMESLDFGGLIGGGGPARVPQIRWTEPLAGWGLLGALSVSAEAPETHHVGAGRTQISGRTRHGSAADAEAASGAFAALGTPGNPLKATAPDMVGAWYIPQPWGHVDFAAVVRPMLRVETPFGAPLTSGVDRTYLGYGFAFSGDVKPGWLGWNKDFFTWNFVGRRGDRALPLCRQRQRRKSGVQYYRQHAGDQLDPGQADARL